MAIPVVTLLNAIPGMVPANVAKYNAPGTVVKFTSCWFPRNKTLPGSGVGDTANGRRNSFRTDLERKGGPEGLPDSMMSRGPSGRNNHGTIIKRYLKISLFIWRQPAGRPAARILGGRICTIFPAFSPRDKDWPGGAGAGSGQRRRCDDGSCA